MKKAWIALEDGTVFEGEAFAGEGEARGELVFNTSMTGYQEILTDPSYHGQIVTMTYPLIGNYGVSPQDAESERPRAAGLVVGECSRVPSNWRCAESLPDYLGKHGVMGIHRVDTRAVTLHIRDKGAMRCVLSTEDTDPARLVDKARSSAGLVGRDLAGEVSTSERYSFPGPQAERAAFSEIQRGARAAYDGLFDDTMEGRFPFRVAVLDCGIKTNQLRLLARYGCALEVFPIRTPADEILAWNPDGVFISNGPGDPQGVPYAVEEIRRLIDSGKPVFGICFGHQLIALALGAQTFKLKFGHRGGNHPIMDHTTGKVEIASHNHGFCVDMDRLPENVEVTHINLNDRTCAGIRHTGRPVFSVQYHPEACPGPHDSLYLFTRFMKLIETTNNG